MTDSAIQVAGLRSSNISDRLWLCWGHLSDWRNIPVVQRSNKWLQQANSLFAPTTFIAYVGKTPAGMIEFMPNRLLKELGLCPCRVDKENQETEDRYILGKEFDDCIFISCLSVSKNQQGNGVGKTLLRHLLESKAFRGYRGALVYAREKDPSWEKFIHWPAGPKEFYVKAGFSIAKALENPAGHILYYMRQHG